MSPEDEFAFEKLAKAERVIKALDVLAKECAGEGLDAFADRIKDCVVLCQNDYVTLHRTLYQQNAGRPPKPPGTKH
ncbi:hypothetical protein [Asticcacaulis sp.]|uniref:hypothetical protein n=1 Tax=Asticcacaulis sp. TaxID=1872648 RepID=UPI003F7CA3C5